LSGSGGGAGGDSKSGLKLDGNATRDSVAFGALTGGILGLLAIGIGAGPAGIIGAAIIGAILGFGFFALSKAGDGDKDKK